MYSDMAQKLMNNYVFQNRFRKYFYNNFEDILQSLSPISNINKAKSTPFFIEGIFGLKRRIINFPNIFSYAYSISKIDSLNLSDFGKLASSNNKMQIDFDERKFKSTYDQRKPESKRKHSHCIKRDGEYFQRKRSRS